MGIWIERRTFIKPMHYPLIMVIIQTSPPSIKKYVDAQDAKKVSKTGDTMTGALTIARNSDEPSLLLRRNDVDVTNPSGSADRNLTVLFRDKNSINAGWVGTSFSKDGDVSTILLAHNRASGTNYDARLGVVADYDKSTYAYAPTPSAKNDNSTKIATTAWVNTASTVVHKTGNETIAGTKTFTSPITDPRNKTSLFTTPNSASDSSAKPYYKVVSFSAVGAYHGSELILRVSNPYTADSTMKDANTIRLGLKVLNLASTSGAVSSLTLKILPGGLPSKYLSADCFKVFYNTTTKIVELWYSQATQQISYLTSIEEIGGRGSKYFSSLSMPATPTGTAALPSTSDGWTQVDCTYGDLSLTDASLNISGKGAMVTLNDARYANADTVTSTMVQSIFYTDKDGLNTGAIEHNRYADGRNTLKFNVRSPSGSWMSQPMYVTKSNTAEYITGPTPSAKNDNSTKIATTAWVNTASTVVHKTGNETIAGVKTFTSPTVVKQTANTAYAYRVASLITSRDTAPTANQSIDMMRVEDGSGLLCAGMGLDYKTTNVRDIHLTLRHKGANIFMGLTSNGTDIWGYAPTPLSSAKGTEIATAKWVNDKLSAIKDANDKVSQTNLTDMEGLGTNMPLLMKITTDDGSISVDDNVTAEVGFVPTVMVNPAEGSISANTFIGNLTGTASKASSATSADTAIRALRDGNGLVIADTYLKASTLPTASSSTLGCVKVGKGLEMNANVLAVAAGDGLTASASALDWDYEYVYQSYKMNTWYSTGNYCMIIAIKTYQTQNLQLRIKQPGAQASSYTHVADHWDNNQGDGRATLTIALPAGIQYYIESNNTSTRDHDNNNMITGIKISTPRQSLAT